MPLSRESDLPPRVQIRYHSQLRRPLRTTRSGGRAVHPQRSIHPVANPTRSIASMPPRQCRSYVVVPARRASTRLPDKMLLRETGKTLIEHTYQAALGARRPCGVLIATDDAEIRSEVERFGGRAIMTSPACASGTDRVAEAASGLSDAEIVVNLQGDEPEMASRAIDQVIELLEANPAAGMSTLACPLASRRSLVDPACVKVVFDRHGRAMYFSRSPIPFVRDEPAFPRSPTGEEGAAGTSDAPPIGADGEPLFYQHLGIYAYRRNFLLRLAATPPCELELAEKLEQLRVLQMGETILVGVIDHSSSGIDTPTDYAQFVARRKAG
jgi:3-deoxy-manno-octulosonate cytidylyltransferase (CMP-KDO synthetase)